MAGICDGRVVIITGGGRGIGREHALEFARQGAKVVVNDLGSTPDGNGSSEGPAGEVVDAIRAMGGEAVANGDDCSDYDAAQLLVRAAVDTFGGLDVLVNNAGILRDRMLVSMKEDEWDAVIRVHLKGTYAPSHHAANYWRERAKAGETNDARIVNTSSAAGLFGNVGQTNYAAAKAGIAAMTRVMSAELERLRRDRQRHRPHRSHPHDRGPLPRLDEDPGRRRVRRHGSRQHLAARRVAGQPRLQRRDRPDHRGRRRQAVGRVGLATRSRDRQGRPLGAGRGGPAIRDLMAKATPNVKVIGSR